MYSIYHPSLNVAYLKNEFKLRTSFDFDVSVKMKAGFKRFEMTQEEFIAKTKFQYKYLCNLMKEQYIGNFKERSNKNYLILCPPGVDYTKPISELNEDPCDSITHPFVGKNLGTFETEDENVLRYCDVLSTDTHNFVYYGWYGDKKVCELRRQIKDLRPTIKKRIRMEGTRGYKKTLKRETELLTGKIFAQFNFLPKNYFY